MEDRLIKPPGKREINRISRLIGLGIFFFCITIYLFFEPQIINDIEGRLLDARFKVRGKQPTSDAVAIIAIDDASLQSLGRWPWPRNRIAEMIEKINAEGAAAIGLDIVFAEPSSDDMLKAFRESATFSDSMNRQYEEFTASQAPDKRLARTLSLYGNIATGNYFYTDPKAAEQVLKSDEIDSLVQRSAISAIKAKKEDYKVTTALAVASNIEDIVQAGAGSGFFNTRAGKDGIVRHMPLLIRYKDDLYPSLALRLLSVAMGNTSIVVHIEEFGISHISVGPHEILTDEMGRIVLNYLGPEKTIDTYSAIDLLQGKLPAGSLRDKIVLLGVPAVGVSDVRATPFGASFPGVEIQATALENIILQNPIVINNLDNLIDISIMLVIVMLLVIIMPKIKGMFRRSLAASAVVLIYLVVNQYLFNRHGQWVSIAYPLIAWMMTYTLLSVYLSVIVESSYSVVRNAFKSYLHPGLVDKLAENPNLISFGGEQKELSILFSDIRNFTNLSENLEPQQLSRFLQCYMDPMTEQVFQSRGTVDKYIGDAVMAFFGAPYPSDIHPENACNCALGMIERLDDIVKCCPDLERLFPIRIGIGIHTGEAVVGNFGSSQRFNYTVLGDSVNLASRLEGLSKAYGVNIVVSETTYNEVSSEFVFRELDMVRVKGKQQPIRLYELRGKQASDYEEEMLDLWETALTEYKHKNWLTAIEKFEHINNSYGHDKACDLYIDRSQEYAKNPPGESWDGVYTYTTK